MLRSLAKSTIAAGLHAVGGERLLRRNHGLPLVVGYHRTVADFPTDPQRTIPAMCISTAMLERQLDWIGRRFRFVSLDEVGALMETQSPEIERVAAVTFDDGYRDFYEQALPLLKRKGIPAAVFVVSGHADTAQLQIHDLLYLLLIRMGSPNPHVELEAMMDTMTQEELLRHIDAMRSCVDLGNDILEEHRSMDWSEIRAARAAGITIGSHTESHAVLTSESASRVEREITASKEMLEARLGGEIRHFAYPCGQYGAATVQAVADAGYRFAYTICPHRDAAYPLLTIPRKLLWEKSCVNVLRSFSPSIMSCHVYGAFDSMSACTLRHAPSGSPGPVGPGGGAARDSLGAPRVARGVALQQPNPY